MQTGKRNFKKVLRPRGSNWEIFSKNKSDLSPKDGDIEEIEDNDGDIIGYVQKFPWISGDIDDVIVQKRYVKRGDKTIREYEIDVHLFSGKEDVILRMGFDQGSGQSFAVAFRNVNLKKEICFLSWQLTPESGRKYGKSGISMCYGTDWNKENKVEPFYTKKYTESKGLDFMKDSRGEKKFDKEGYADWLYDQFIQDVHYAFGHYEEKPQEEPRNRDEERGHDRGGSDRNSRRDDDNDRGGRNSERGRGGDRDSNSRDSRREEDRGRKDDDRGRNSRRDEGEDRGGRNSRNDRDDDGRDSRRNEDEDRGGRNSRNDDGGSEREYRSRGGNDRDTGPRDESRNSRRNEEPEPYEEPGDLPF